MSNLNIADPVKVDDVNIHIEIQCSDSDSNDIKPAQKKQPTTEELEKERKKLLETVKDEPLCDRIKGYLLVLWDGPTFYGMDTSRLERVKGEPVTFFTKCQSCNWVLATISLLSITIYVVVQAL